jgi:hypothetical protein
MLNERALELINAEIDGELAAGEQEELDTLLGASDEARALRGEMQRMAELLETEPSIPPPAGLSKEILARVAPQTYPAFSLAGLFTPFRPATGALTFACGMLLTVLIYQLGGYTASPMDTDRLVGTMIQNPAGQGALLDSREIGAVGAVSLRQAADDMLVLEFNLETGAGVEIEVQFADAGLGFGGIAATANRAAAEERYEVTEGTLRVVSQGRQAFSVFLPAVDGRESAGREIRIDMSAGGEQLFSGILNG